MPGATSSFLLLVVWPGAPSSVLAPSSDALFGGTSLGVDLFVSAREAMVVL